MIPAVPIRTRLLDARGFLTRTWMLFFESLAFERVMRERGLLADLPTLYHPTTNPDGMQQADAGYEYEATDYEHTYVWHALEGKVSTAGTTVTCVAGDLFGQDMAGKTITINSVDYTIASVTNSTTLVLTASAGTQTAVPYLCMYWDWAPGERSGYVGYFAVAPQGAGWKLCDGTGNPVTYCKRDGTTATLTLPDMRGMFLKGAATAGTAQVSATAPGVTGSASTTGDHSHASTGLSGVTDGPSSWNNVPQGTGGLIGLANNVHAHNVSISGSVASSGSHTHTLSLTADTSGAPAHVELMPYFRQ
jgi:hypothetical protein